MAEWRPHPKQEQALTSNAFETLYGGARGGGKTDAGMIWLLYNKEIPKARSLVIRKNSTDLGDWISRAKEMYRSQGATFVGNEIRFSTGYTIVMGHLKDDNSYTKYQGHEYQMMLIEELTQIPSEELYMKLIASCRSTIDGVKPQIFCTTNPDGVGRYWVKQRFIKDHEPLIPFEDEISGRMRVYIPATVEDNPVLMEKDPEYIKFLESLEPELRAQWRYGSWDHTLIKGAIYGGEMLQAHQEGRIGHYPISPYHPVHVLFDIGLNDLMVAWFFQRIDNKLVFVDLLWDHNKEWDHYAKEIRLRGYEIGTIFTPHDGNRRSGDTLRTFNETLESHRFKVEMIPRPKTKLVVHDRTKVVFPRVHFDLVKCEDGIQALESYRREYDDIRQVYKDNPVHDENSHFADGFGLIQPADALLAPAEMKVKLPKRDMTDLAKRQFGGNNKPKTVAGAF